MRNILRLALIAAALTSACSDSLFGEECPDIGCLNEVTVTVTTNGGVPYPDGRYVVEATLDGNVVRGDCNLVRSGGTCSADSTVMMGRRDDKLELRLRGTPKHVELTLRFNDATFGSSVFDPSYSTSSNGEQCKPTCRGATHAMTVEAPSVASPDAGAD